MGDGPGPITPQRKPVRVGVLLDSLTVPAWVDASLEQLSSAGAELTPVVVDRTAREHGSTLDRLRGAFPHVLYDLYTRIDRRVFRSSGDALDPVDARNRFTCDVLELGAEDLTRPENLARIAEYSLDVLVSFRTGGTDGEVSRAARHGLWSYSLNDESGVGFFQFLARGEHVTCTELLAQEENGDRRAILRSFSAADAISLHRARNDALWKASSFPARLLRDLPPPELDDGRIQPLESHPTNLQMTRFLVGLGGRMAVGRAHRTVFRLQWFIAYRRRQPDVPPRDLKGCTLFLPPTDRFYADPFLFSAPDGRRYLFFEDWRNAHGKALISRVELFPDGTVSSPTVVLERDYHLSYPFVFTSGDEIYLLPETADARRVELYRAVEFPDRWEPDRVLVDGEAMFDATLLERDGKVWMFTNLATPQGTPSYELSVFWSDSLDGEWHPHAQNPVVSDVRCARPAGRMIAHGDRLIRPAQDGSVRYGYALAFREILDLTPDSYAEVDAGRITPESIQGNLGTHHYDADAEFEVFDGRLAVPRWRSRTTHVLRSPS
jgi:hypothetical protein